MSEKVKDSFLKTQKAINRLEEMLAQPIDEHRAVIDSTIQRFEFSLELMVRLLQRILESKLEHEVSTKAILIAAYRLELIDDEKAWINMLQDRGLTVHSYNEAFADKMYESIKTEYFPVLSKTLKSLEDEVG